MTCWLYRHFDADGALLYVGVTLDILRRGREHAAMSDWFVHVVGTTFESFPTRDAATIAERTAVIMERPRYNVVYRRQARELQVQLVRARLEEEKKNLGFT